MTSFYSGKLPSENTRLCVVFPGIFLVEMVSFMFMYIYIYTYVSLRWVLLNAIGYSYISIECSTTLKCGSVFIYIYIYIYIYICSICRRTFRCTTAHQCSSERTWIDKGPECSNRYSSGGHCLTLSVILIYPYIYIYIYIFSLSKKLSRLSIPIYRSHDSLVCINSSGLLHV